MEVELFPCSTSSVLTATARFTAPVSVSAISFTSAFVRESVSRDALDCKSNVAGPVNWRNNRSPNMLLLANVRAEKAVDCKNRQVGLSLIVRQNCVSGKYLLKPANGTCSFRVVLLKRYGVGGVIVELYATTLEGCTI